MGVPFDDGSDGSVDGPLSGDGTGSKPTGVDPQARDDVCALLPWPLPVPEIGEVSVDLFRDARLLTLSAGGRLDRTDSDDVESTTSLLPSFEHFRGDDCGGFAGPVILTSVG